MKILTPPSTSNYRLIDSGDGHKLEQFGNNTIIRPDSNCVWARQHPERFWQRANASYTRVTKGKEQSWQWRVAPTFKEPWLFTFHLPTLRDEKRTISCQLRTSTSKNIGIFPEQMSNWEWMVDRIDSSKTNPHVLNLFAHTGGATLCASAAGAQVCHVDASSAAVNWARQNHKLSKLDETSVRWIVDDCATFVSREIKRGNVYDALIIDPPAFGRDPKGKQFAFEKHVYTLLGLCKKVLRPDPLFVIFNGYAMGHSATVLNNLLSDFYRDKKIECGELHVAEHGSNRTLPCSLFARF